MDWNTYWTLIFQVLLAFVLLGTPTFLLTAVLRLAWGIGK